MGKGNSNSYLCGTESSYQNRSQFRKTNGSNQDNEVFVWTYHIIYIIYISKCSINKKLSILQHIFLELLWLAVLKAYSFDKYTIHILQFGILLAKRKWRRILKCVSRYFLDIWINETWTNSIRPIYSLYWPFRNF